MKVNTFYLTQITDVHDQGKLRHSEVDIYLYITHHITSKLIGNILDERSSSKIMLTSFHIFKNRKKTSMTISKNKCT